MRTWYGKSPVVAGILIGQGLMILFVLFEYFLVASGISDCGVIVDSCIRVLFGLMALWVIHTLWRGRFSALFITGIPKSTWLYCIPFFLYLALEFLFFPVSDRIATAYVPYFLLVCLQQLATGFLEEAASKGLVMSGMRLRWKRTVKGRIGMVLLTGLFFGSLHILNVLFNHDWEQSLWNALYSSAFGIFLAAIYLHAGNITLCMALHAAWDIIIRIPGYFCEGIREGAVTAFIYLSQDILLLGILPIIAVALCVAQNKANQAEEEILRHSGAVS